MSRKRSPPPDPAQQNLANTQAEVMREQLGLTREQFQWQKDRALEMDRRGDEEFAYQRGLADEVMGWARKDRDFFDETTGRQVREFNRQVDAYDTGAERDRIAGRAMVDVEDAMERGRASLGREMGARGLNTGSGAFLASLTDMQTEGALAKAAAATMAQDAARREGLQLRAQAAGLGMPYGGMASSGVSQASGLRTTGLDAGTLGMRSMASAGAGLNAGFSGANAWGNSANSTFNSVYEQRAARAKSGFNIGGAIMGGLKGFSTGGGWGAAAGALGGGFGG